MDQLNEAQKQGNDDRAMEHILERTPLIQSDLEEQFTQNIGHGNLLSEKDLDPEFVSQQEGVAMATQPYTFADEAKWEELAAEEKRQRQKVATVVVCKRSGDQESIYRFIKQGEMETTKMEVEGEPEWETREISAGPGDEWLSGVVAMVTQSKDGSGAVEGVHLPIDQPDCQGSDLASTDIAVVIPAASGAETEKFAGPAPPHSSSSSSVTVATSQSPNWPAPSIEQSDTLIEMEDKKRKQTYEQSSKSFEWTEVREVPKQKRQQWERFESPEPPHSPGYQRKDTLPHSKQAASGTAPAARYGFTAGIIGSRQVHPDVTLSKLGHSQYTETRGPQHGEVTQRTEHKDVKIPERSTFQPKIPKFEEEEEETVTEVLQSERGVAQSGETVIRRQYQQQKRKLVSMEQGGGFKITQRVQRRMVSERQPQQQQEPTVLLPPPSTPKRGPTVPPKPSVMLKDDHTARRGLDPGTKPTVGQKPIISPKPVVVIVKQPQNVGKRPDMTPKPHIAPKPGTKPQVTPKPQKTEVVTKPDVTAKPQVAPKPGFVPKQKADNIKPGPGPVPLQKLKPAVAPKPAIVIKPGPGTGGTPKETEISGTTKPAALPKPILGSKPSSVPKRGPRKKKIPKHLRKLNFSQISSSQGVIPEESTMEEIETLEDERAFEEIEDIDFIDEGDYDDDDDDDENMETVQRYQPNDKQKLEAGSEGVVSVISAPLADMDEFNLSDSSTEKPDKNQLLSAEVLMEPKKHLSAEVLLQPETHLTTNVGSSKSNARLVTDRHKQTETRDLVQLNPLHMIVSYKKENEEEDSWDELEELYEKEECASNQMESTGSVEAGMKTENDSQIFYDLHKVEINQQKLETRKTIETKHFVVTSEGKEDVMLTHSRHDKEKESSVEVPQLVNIDVTNIVTMETTKDKLAEPQSQVRPTEIDQMPLLHQFNVSEERKIRESKETQVGPDIPGINVEVQYKTPEEAMLAVKHSESEMETTKSEIKSVDDKRVSNIEAPQLVTIEATEIVTMERARDELEEPQSQITPSEIGQMTILQQISLREQVRGATESRKIQTGSETVLVVQQEMPEQEINIIQVVQEDLPQPIPEQTDSSLKSESDPQKTVMNKLKDCVQEPKLVTIESTDIVTMETTKDELSEPESQVKSTEIGQMVMLQQFTVSSQNQVRQSEMSQTDSGSSVQDNLPSIQIVHEEQSEHEICMMDISKVEIKDNTEAPQLEVTEVKETEKDISDVVMKEVKEVLEFKVTEIKQSEKDISEVVVKEVKEASQYEVTEIQQSEKDMSEVVMKEVKEAPELKVTEVKQTEEDISEVVMKEVEEASQYEGTEIKQTEKDISEIVMKEVKESLAKQSEKDVSEVTKSEKRVTEVLKASEVMEVKSVTEVKDTAPNDHKDSYVEMPKLVTTEAPKIVTIKPTRDELAEPETPVPPTEVGHMSLFQHLHLIKQSQNMEATKETQVETEESLASIEVQEGGVEKESVDMQPEKASEDQEHTKQRVLALQTLHFALKADMAREQTLLAPAQHDKMGMKTGETETFEQTVEQNVHPASIAENTVQKELASEVTVQETHNSGQIVEKKHILEQPVERVQVDKMETDAGEQPTEIESMTFEDIGLPKDEMDETEDLLAQYKAMYSQELGCVKAGKLYETAMADVQSDVQSEVSESTLEPSQPVEQQQPVQVIQPVKKVRSQPEISGLLPRSQYLNFLESQAPGPSQSVMDTDEQTLEETEMTTPVDIPTEPRLIVEQSLINVGASEMEVVGDALIPESAQFAPKAEDEKPTEQPQSETTEQSESQTADHREVISKHSVKQTEISEKPIKEKAIFEQTMEEAPPAGDKIADSDDELMEIESIAFEDIRLPQGELDETENLLAKFKAMYSLEQQSSKEVELQKSEQPDSQSKSVQGISEQTLELPEQTSQGDIPSEPQLIAEQSLTQLECVQEPQTGHSEIIMEQRATQSETLTEQTEQTRTTVETDKKVEEVSKPEDIQMIRFWMRQEGNENDEEMEDSQKVVAAYKKMYDKRMNTGEQKDSSKLAEEVRTELAEAGLFMVAPKEEEILAPIEQTVIKDQRTSMMTDEEREADLKMRQELEDQKRKAKTTEGPVWDDEKGVKMLPVLEKMKKQREAMQADLAAVKERRTKTEDHELEAFHSSAKENEDIIRLETLYKERQKMDVRMDTLQTIHQAVSAALVKEQTLLVKLQGDEEGEVSAETDKSNACKELQETAQMLEEIIQLQEKVEKSKDMPAPQRCFQEDVANILNLNTAQEFEAELTMLSKLIKERTKGEGDSQPSEAEMEETQIVLAAYKKMYSDRMEGREQEDRSEVINEVKAELEEAGLWVPPKVEEILAPIEQIIIKDQRTSLMTEEEREADIRMRQELEAKKLKAKQLEGPVWDEGKETDTKMLSILDQLKLKRQKMMKEIDELKEKREITETYEKHHFKAEVAYTDAMEMIYGLGTQRLDMLSQLDDLEEMTAEIDARAARPLPYHSSEESSDEEDEDEEKEHVGNEGEDKNDKVESDKKIKMDVDSLDGDMDEKDRVLEASTTPSEDVVTDSSLLGQLQTEHLELTLASQGEEVLTLNPETDSAIIESHDFMKLKQVEHREMVIEEGHEAVVVVSPSTEISLECQEIMKNENKNEQCSDPYELKTMEQSEINLTSHSQECITLASEIKSEVITGQTQEFIEEVEEIQHSTQMNDVTVNTDDQNVLILSTEMCPVNLEGQQIITSPEAEVKILTPPETVQKDKGQSTEQHDVTFVSERPEVLTLTSETDIIVSSEGHKMVISPETETRIMILPETVEREEDIELIEKDSLEGDVSIERQEREGSFTDSLDMEVTKESDMVEKKTVVEVEMEKEKVPVLVACEVEESKESELVASERIEQFMGTDQRVEILVQMDKRKEHEIATPEMELRTDTTETAEKTDVLATKTDEIIEPEKRTEKVTPETGAIEDTEPVATETGKKQDIILIVECEEDSKETVTVVLSEKEKKESVVIVVSEEEQESVTIVLREAKKEPAEVQLGEKLDKLLSADHDIMTRLMEKKQQLLQCVKVIDKLSQETEVEQVKMQQQSEEFQEIKRQKSLELLTPEALQALDSQGDYEHWSLTSEESSMEESPITGHMELLKQLKTKRKQLMKRLKSIEKEESDEDIEVTGNVTEEMNYLEDLKSQREILLSGLEILQRSTHAKEVHKAYLLEKLGRHRSTEQYKFGPDPPGQVHMLEIQQSDVQEVDTHQVEVRTETTERMDWTEQSDHSMIWIGQAEKGEELQRKPTEQSDEEIKPIKPKEKPEVIEENDEMEITSECQLIELVRQHSETLDELEQKQAESEPILIGPSSQTVEYSENREMEEGAVGGAEAISGEITDENMEDHYLNQLLVQSEELDYQTSDLTEEMLLSELARTEEDMGSEEQMTSQMAEEMTLLSNLRTEQMSRIQEMQSEQMKLMETLNSVQKVRKVRSSLMNILKRHSPDPEEKSLLETHFPVEEFKEMVPKQKEPLPKHTETLLEPQENILLETHFPIEDFKESVPGQQEPASEPITDSIPEQREMIPEPTDCVNEKRNQLEIVNPEEANTNNAVRQTDAIAEIKSKLSEIGIVVVKGESLIIKKDSKTEYFDKKGIAQAELPDSSVDSLQIMSIRTYVQAKEKQFALEAEREVKRQEYLSEHLEHVCHIDEPEELSSFEQQLEVPAVPPAEIEVHQTMKGRIDEQKIKYKELKQPEEGVGEEEVEPPSEKEAEPSSEKEAEPPGGMELTEGITDAKDLMEIAEEMIMIHESSRLVQEEELEEAKCDNDKKAEEVIILEEQSQIEDNKMELELMEMITEQLGHSKEADEVVSPTGGDQSDSITATDVVEIAAHINRKEPGNGMNLSEAITANDLVEIAEEMYRKEDGGELVKQTEQMAIEVCEEEVMHDTEEMDIELFGGDLMQQIEQVAIKVCGGELMLHAEHIVVEICGGELMYETEQMVIEVCGAELQAEQMVCGEEKMQRAEQVVVEICGGEVMYQTEPMASEICGGNLPQQAEQMVVQVCGGEMMQQVELIIVEICGGEMMYKTEPMVIEVQQEEQMVVQVYEGEMLQKTERMVIEICGEEAMRQAEQRVINVDGGMQQTEQKVAEVDGDSQVVEHVKTVHITQRTVVTDSREVIRGPDGQETVTTEETTSTTVHDADMLLEQIEKQNELLQEMKQLTENLQSSNTPEPESQIQEIQTKDQMQDHREVETSVECFGHTLKESNSSLLSVQTGEKIEIIRITEHTGDDMQETVLDKAEHSVEKGDISEDAGLEVEITHDYEDTQESEEGATPREQDDISLHLDWLMEQVEQGEPHEPNSPRLSQKNVMFQDVVQVMVVEQSRQADIIQSDKPILDEIKEEDEEEYTEVKVKEYVSTEIQKMQPTTEQVGETIEQVGETTVHVDETTVQVGEDIKETKQLEYVEQEHNIPPPDVSVVERSELTLNSQIEESMSLTSEAQTIHIESQEITQSENVTKTQVTNIKTEQRHLMQTEDSELTLTSEYQKPEILISETDDMTIESGEKMKPLTLTSDENVANLTTDLNRLNVEGQESITSIESDHQQNSKDGEIKEKDQFEVALTSLPSDSVMLTSESREAEVPNIKDKEKFIQEDVLLQSTERRDIFVASESHEMISVISDIQTASIEKQEIYQKDSDTQQSIISKNEELSFKSEKDVELDHEKMKSIKDDIQVGEILQQFDDKIKSVENDGTPQSTTIMDGTTDTSDKVTSEEIETKIVSTENKSEIIEEEHVTVKEFLQKYDVGSGKIEKPKIILYKRVGEEMANKKEITVISSEGRVEEIRKRTEIMSFVPLEVDDGNKEIRKRTVESAKDGKFEITFEEQTVTERIVEEKQIIDRPKHMDRHKATDKQTQQHRGVREMDSGKVGGEKRLLPEGVVSRKSETGEDKRESLGEISEESHIGVKEALLKFSIPDEKSQVKPSQPKGGNSSKMADSQVTMVMVTKEDEVTKGEKVKEEQQIKSVKHAVQQFDSQKDEKPVSKTDPTIKQQPSVQIVTRRENTREQIRDEKRYSMGMQTEMTEVVMVKTSQPLTMETKTENVVDGKQIDNVKQAVQKFDVKPKIGRLEFAGGGESSKTVVKTNIKTSTVEKHSRETTQECVTRSEKKVTERDSQQKGTLTKEVSRTKQPWVAKDTKTMVVKDTKTLVAKKSTGGDREDRRDKQQKNVVEATCKLRKVRNVSIHFLSFMKCLKTFLTEHECQRLGMLEIYQMLYFLVYSCCSSLGV